MRQFILNGTLMPRRKVVWPRCVCGARLIVGVYSSLLGRRFCSIDCLCEALPE